MPVPNHQNKSIQNETTNTKQEQSLICNTTTTTIVTSAGANPSPHHRNKKLKTNSKMSKNNSEEPTSTKKNSDDFEIVRAYLLECPKVGKDSPAIKAALEGLEKEEKRRIRDAKLRSKFGGVSAPAKSQDSSDNDGLVVVEKDAVSGSVILNDSRSSNNSNDDDMEWQDVKQQAQLSTVVVDDDVVPAVQSLDDSFTDTTTNNEEETSCYLGKTLSTACIEALAKQDGKVLVSSPLAAIAVALHASLRSDVLGFACTGVPEDSTKKGGGFAPPVREITGFLPKDWGNNNNEQPQPLRYRKPDTGALVLTVRALDSGDIADSNGNPSTKDTQCSVTLVRAVNSSKEDDSSNDGLVFTLSDHINLDSWNAATRIQKKIAPALHYKNLSGLLSKFCRTFDLGALHKDNSSIDETMKDASVGMVMPIKSSNSSSVRMPLEPSGVFVDRAHASSRHKNYVVPTTLDQAFPPAAAAASARRGNHNDFPSPHGDFADDLLPGSSGLMDPRFARPGRLGGTGNLMGPNHPMFSQGGGPGGFAPTPGNLPMRGGPGTMQPRFDPMMPPGVGGNEFHPNLQQQQQQQQRRRNPGEPNPDHLPPPNSFGNDMFM